MDEDLSFLDDVLEIKEEKKGWKPFTAEEIAEWDAKRNARKGNLDQEDGFDCKECNNKGFYFKNDTYYTCGCLWRRVAYQKARLKGLDTERTLDNYKTTFEWQIRAKNEALRYIENPIGWFFVGGQSGAGKTHLCNAICLELLKSKSVKYLDWRVEATRLKAKLNTDAYISALDEILNEEVLYIDDLFKGTLSDGDKNLAWQILNWRYIRKMPTIISTEMTIDGIWAKDEALAGRIKEMCKYCGCIPLIIEGADKNQRSR